MTVMGHLDHKATSPASVRCYVLTVSDTRTPATDTSGSAIAELLEANGHEVAGRAIVRDEPGAIRETLQRQLDDAATRVIITTGGTGITSRDSTYEVVCNLLEKRLEGFGELFRMLSYQEIGPSAMMSRACAGTSHGKIVVSLPGSEHAVRLGMNKLLLPELGHLVRELSR
jgi:molybdopterin adenylyltransferase